MVALPERNHSRQMRLATRCGCGLVAGPPKFGEQAVDAFRTVGWNGDRRRIALLLGVSRLKHQRRADQNGQTENQ